MATRKRPKRAREANKHEIGANTGPQCEQCGTNMVPFGIPWVHLWPFTATPVLRVGVNDHSLLLWAPFWPLKDHFWYQKRTQKAIEQQRGARIMGLHHFLFHLSFCQHHVYRKISQSSIYCAAWMSALSSHLGI